MDRLEKIILLTSVGLMSAFFVALLAASEIGKVSVPPCLPPSATYTQPRIDTLPDGTLRIFYVSRMWRFDPDYVEVPRGTPVEIYLVTSDVVHGLYIPYTNVNIMAVPGAVNKYTHLFTKSGMYDVVCHEYCGSSHQGMRAQIVVR
ncbi:MAG: cytochrome c oxidase subunit II [Bacteroidia bacterium]